MKRTEYRCDICQDVLCTLDSERLKPFVAFEFSSTPMFRWSTVAWEMQRHICLPCLEGLAAVCAEVREQGVS